MQRKTETSDPNPSQSVKLVKNKLTLDSYFSLKRKNPESGATTDIFSPLEVKMSIQNSDSVQAIHEKRVKVGSDSDVSNTLASTTAAVSVIVASKNVLVTIAAFSHFFLILIFLKPDPIQDLEEKQKVVDKEIKETKVNFFIHIQLNIRVMLERPR
jgi:hypothetical protein